MTKSIQNQLFNNDCINSPFEGGKSAFADAGDVISKNKKHLPTLTTLSFFLCLFISSCSKTSTNPSSNYPTYSESGKNVFALKFNGNQFINCNPDKGTTAGIECTIYSDHLGLFMDNTCNTQALTLTAIFNSFTNKLGDTMYLKPELNDKIEFGQDLPVRIRSNKIRTNFWLVFNKYDKAAQIVAGHFGGILIDDSTKKDIVITDGFFDWHSNVLLK